MQGNQLCGGQKLICAPCFTWAKSWGRWKLLSEWLRHLNIPNAGHKCQPFHFPRCLFTGYLRFRRVVAIYSLDILLREKTASWEWSNVEKLLIYIRERVDPDENNKWGLLFINRMSRPQMSWEASVLFRQSVHLHTTNITRVRSRAQGEIPGIN